ncbi:MAG TPA: MarR family winged helix-turn-helix transcriptional regulator [Minicystis sp.]|nr:MarR family winged helix-turn-helix transcriptional regulator [Minicystis sp.]
MAKASASSALLAEELYRLVGRARRLLWQAAARCLEARGESIFTWQTVCYLARNGPTAQKDLAYANAQHPAGISRLVEELEAEGLVTRTADPTDRRRQLVSATPKGKAWLDRTMPVVTSAVDEALAGLDRRDREALRDLLRAMLGEGAP